MTWYSYNLLSIFILDILSIVCILMIIAYITVVERKYMAYMQRRVGPNSVGIFGTLQAFSDAIKLVIKEVIYPIQSNSFLFWFSPIISLFISIILWCIIPLTEYFVIYNNNINIIVSICINSISVFGIVFAGWSANNKYTFISTIRSTAQVISYELVFGIILILIMFVGNSFNFINIIYNQIYVYNIFILIPVYILFWISVLAESGRTPFDLIEAESELVAGYMTEHSSVIFVFFFLSEYSSIVFFSTIISILFYGGFIFNTFIINTIYFTIQPIVLGIKSIINMIIFVWVRATLPRIKFEQLMQFCWIDLLPVCIGFIFVIFSVVILFILYKYIIYIYIYI